MIEEEQRTTELIHPPLLPPTDEIVKPITEKEEIQLRALDIPLEDAEELSALFSKEIPTIVVQKKNTIARVKEMLLPRQWQRWRRKNKR